MSSVINHTVRTLDQELDTIEICPDHPDYMVVGTYSLITKKPHLVREENEEETTAKSDTPHRVGSLQVLPVREEDRLKLENETDSYPARQDFPCAFLDIHFHPDDGTLLAAATSVGDLRFFRFVWHLDSDQPEAKRLQIVPLGVVKLYGDDDGDEASLPLITQFNWIDMTEKSHVHDSPATRFNVCLATCDTTGQTKIVGVLLPPNSSSEVAEAGVDTDRSLVFQAQDIHKHLHGLEAWTVSSIALERGSDLSEHLVLSGGDDGCLIASLCTMSSLGENEEILDKPPLRVFLDKRTHTAGVVSILPLDTINSDTRILLTGSYDQYLRLHHLTSNRSVSHVSEIQLEGGVWRISLVDKYPDDSESGQQQNWILLISAMHAGCYIIRLMARSNAGDREGTLDWHWEIEEHFREPHESMVYASAAILQDPQVSTRQTRKWTIISTSFYDKRICVWEWIDTKRPKIV